MADGSLAITPNVDFQISALESPERAIETVCHILDVLRIAADGNLDSEGRDGSIQALLELSVELIQLAESSRA